jgi:hypothetical protein
MGHRFNFRHPDARAASPIERLLLGVLGLLLVLVLLLPVVRDEGLLYPGYHLKFGDVAELQNLGMIYKSDDRGTYAVLDANWRFTQPLQPGDHIVYHLSRPDSQEASHIDLTIGHHEGLNPECLAQGGCDVPIAASIRVLKESLAEQYRLTAELVRPGAAATAAFNTPQLVRTLPQSGFSLQRMLLSLGSTLLVCWGLLRVLAPVLRQGLRWRITGVILIANLCFLLLHATFCFRFSEFVVWSEYRINHYYLSWALVTLGWLVSVLVGRHLYMGLIFTTLFAIGLLANFAKISIYGTSLGGDDLNNLVSLVQILIGDHGLWVAGIGASLLVMLWRLRWFNWVLRFIAVLITFFGFSVFAIQASNTVLGPNINYFNNEASYHREMVRRGPSLYLFDLINGLVSGSTIYSYPVATSPLQVQTPTNPSIKPAWDLVIVMQYEALWLGWEGGICKPAPTLKLPATVQAVQQQIHSPTTGGMTVLAEFEMNTGLPVGLVKQGIVPYYYLAKQAAGLARTADELGYSTHFYHPYKQNFWGRDKAIPALGYQHLHFDDEFNALDHKGFYTSDRTLVQHILTQANADSAPQLIYAVTMQGHGPFNQNRYSQQELDAACPGLSESDRQTLNTYYTGVVDAMASLQTLLNGLDASGKHYLLLAFGDHQPYLMSAGTRVLPPHAKTEMTFRIPFMAFSRTGSGPLSEQYKNVRQLFQAGQVTRALLGDRQFMPDLPQPLLHPLLGKEPGFDPASYQQALKATFDATTFHN